MKSCCRWTRSFFVQPAFSREQLEEAEFFLLYCGKGGYTRESVRSMTVDEFTRTTERLHKTMEQERRAQERQMAVAKQQADSARARAKVFRKR